MKNFQRTINGQVYKGKVFEELDLINKLGRTKEEWELVNQYQKTFPQLLIDDVEGFVIDGRTLWKELGEPLDKFADWAKRKICSSFKEDLDYKKGLVIPNDFDELQLANVKEMSKNQLSRYGISNSYTLTLETAKSLALATGIDKKSSDEVREKGDLVRKYFISMEKILKDYEVWTMIREPEKQGWNDMKLSIHDWCVRKGYDFLDNVFYTREANMINVALTGMKASDLNFKNRVDDKQTRDNLQIEVNKAIADLQIINKALLDSDMDFEVRKGIIENTCKNTYSKIKDLV